MSCLRSSIVLQSCLDNTEWVDKNVNWNIQGHHPMHMFLKCIFPCKSTSTLFENTSGTCRNTSFYFSSPQNITKLKRGTSPQGFCCTKSISWGSPLFPYSFPALQHLLCSHWAVLNGPTMFNFPFLVREILCSLCALWLFSKSNLLVLLDAKIT